MGGGGEKKCFLVPFNLAHRKSLERGERRKTEQRRFMGVVEGSKAGKCGEIKKMSTDKGSRVQCYGEGFQ